MQDNTKQNFRDYEVTPHELDKLLQLAEEMQERCDRTTSRIQWYKIFGVIGIMMLSSLFITVLSFRSYDVQVMWFSLLPLILVVPALLALRRIVQRANGELKRDYRALAEVVQMLHETFGVIAKEQKWSPLEVSHFRIRLSRFDIGEKSCGDTRS